MTSGTPGAAAAATERRIVALLLLLTAVSGLVDSVSYLQLGHVFVANMTGNIVFVGFALAGAAGLSPVSTLIAVAAFFAGALGAGRATRSFPTGGALFLGAMTGLELCLVLIGLGATLLTRSEPHTGAEVTVALLAAAMGIQSTTTSRLRIPGINSTVVLTTMLATLAASSWPGGGSGAENGRRLLAIAAMCAGGFIGALLTLRVAGVAALALAAGVLAVACAGAFGTRGVDDDRA